jgi:hypothetical protein
LAAKAAFPFPPRAFSSEADTGSREENASKKILSQIGSDPIRTDQALALRGLKVQSSVAAKILRPGV